MNNATIIFSIVNVKNKQLEAIATAMIISV